MEYKNSDTFNEMIIFKQQLEKEIKERQEALINIKLGGNLKTGHYDRCKDDIDIRKKLSDITEKMLEEVNKNPSLLTLIDFIHECLPTMKEFFKRER